MAMSPTLNRMSGVRVAASPPLMPSKDKQKIKEYQARWYKSHRHEQMARIDAYKKMIAVRFRNIKESSPCKDCGRKFMSCVMDFDHVSGEKIDNVSTLMAKKSSWKKIKEEISKCELVCANCHRIRTFLRSQL